MARLTVERGNAQPLGRHGEAARLYPENGNASIAKVTPAGHKTSLGSQHLALAAVVTKLAHCPTTWLSPRHAPH